MILRDPREILQRMAAEELRNPVKLCGTSGFVGTFLFGGKVLSDVATAQADGSMTVTPTIRQENMTTTSNSDGTNTSKK